MVKKTKSSFSSDENSDGSPLHKDTYKIKKSSSKPSSKKKHKHIKSDERRKRRKRFSSSSSSRSHREKKHKKSRHKKNTHAITSWGKYGVIQEHDQWTKKQEFLLWLLEVKKTNSEGLSAWEEKQLFREYMEDYNTATLPHKKFYNLEKWEQQNAERMQLVKRKSHSDKVSFDDERLRKSELQLSRKVRQEQEFEKTLQHIKEDISKVSDMRHQKMLRTRMQTLFQMGNLKEAQKIQDRLKPELSER